MTSLPPPALPRPEAVLASVFGFPDFRPGQGEVVQAVQAGRDVLVVGTVHALAHRDEVTVNDVAAELRALIVRRAGRRSTHPLRVRLDPVNIG